MARTKTTAPKLSLFPYLPFRAEWKLLPWDAGRAALAVKFGEAYDDTQIQFIGASDTDFYFQLRGHGSVAIPKSTEA